MSRSLFLLLAGIYSLLLAAAMLFIPTASLINYGVAKPDLDHLSIIQYLGMANGMLGFMSIAFRNSPNSYALRVYLLAQAINIIGSVVLGVYQVYGLHVPSSAFFIGDSLFRLALGLGFFYFYTRESRQTGAAALN